MAWFREDCQFSFCEGFRMTAHSGQCHGHGPSSESLQGRKPRIGERKAVPQALWEISAAGRGVIGIVMLQRGVRR